jgi:hypothetical protein
MCLSCDPNISHTTALLNWMPGSTPIGWFLTSNGRPDFDIFMSVPPTAPLRTPDTLKRCLDLLNADCDMVVTGSASARHPAFNMVSRDAQGFVTLAHPSASGVTRRQDTPPLYDLTTVAYVSRPHHILKIGSVLEGRVKNVGSIADRQLISTTSSTLRSLNFSATRRRNE